MHYFTHTSKPQAVNWVNTEGLSVQEIARRHIPRTALCQGCGNRKCALKLASPGYCMATFKSGYRLKSGATTDWLVLDVETAETPEQWRSFERIEVPSHSGGWHVLIRLARTANADEYKATIEKWGEGADDKARDISRFLFATRQDADIQAYTGARLPVEKAAPEPVVEWVQPTNKKTPSARFRDSWISRFVRDPEGSNKLAGGLGSVLAEWGYDDTEIEGTIHSWLQGADSKLDKHARDALRAAGYRREGRPAPGIPSLDKMGVDVSEDVGAPPPGELGGESISAATIECMQLPPVAWLVERYGVCPGAPTIVAGHAGAGKTYLLQDLALAVATAGRQWLGADVRHGSVLHIDHEQGTRETIGRYQDLGIQGTADLDVCVMPLWRLSLDERGETIRKLAKDRALILIDSLRASLPGVDENESGVRAWLDLLTSVSSDTGCVFCLIHHARKGSGEERGTLDVVRGSSGIVDAAGTVLTLTVPTYDDGEPRPSPILRLAKARTWSPRLDWTPQVVQLGREPDGGSTISGAAVEGIAAKIDRGIEETLDQLGREKVAHMTRNGILNYVHTGGSRNIRLKRLAKALEERGWDTKYGGRTDPGSEGGSAQNGE
jgi:hypothetical protein